MGTKIAFFPLLWYCGVAAAQQSFTSKIQGTTSVQGGWAYLEYVLNDTYTIDSTRISNGKFSFVKTFPIPVEALLRTTQGGGRLSLFLENGIYQVKENGGNWALLQAPPTQSKYAVFANIAQARMKLFPLYHQLNSQNDSAGLKKLSRQFDSLNTESTTRARTLLRQNAQTPLCLFLFNNAHNLIASDYTDLEADFVRLPHWAKQSGQGKEIREIIEGAKRTQIGNLAPDFTQADTAGRAVSLRDFRGKYVLVDFWASWCKPCREQNPHLVKAYKQFRDRGFEIIGVSLDRSNDRQKWLAAIRHDGLEWTQVSDLNYFKNAVAILYGIKAIPRNVLIDPEGKIIAKDLRDGAIEQTLAAVLNK